jgi:hypothetical protein
MADHRPASSGREPDAITGCQECITRLAPQAELPPPGQAIGPPVPGADLADLADLADRAARAGFVVLPHVLRNPDEVILVLACPHAVRETGPGGRSPGCVTG